MRVTAKRLRKMEACEYQVKIFEKEWPDGVETTLENLLRAAELKLNLSWFANWCLWGKLGGEYYKRSWTLWEEFDEKTKSVFEECCTEADQIRDEYPVEFLDREERDERVTQVWKGYDEVMAPFCREYYEKIARLMFEALERIEGDK